VPDEEIAIRCEYCGSNVLVPPEYRKEKASSPQYATPQVVMQTYQIDAPEAPAAGRRSARGIVVMILIFVLACFVIGGALSSAGVFAAMRGVNQSIQIITTQSSSSNPGSLPQTAPSATPDLGANLLLSFGTEGSGPGQIDDVRTIAIDPQGNIFVGDFQDGRLQKFDSAGKFAAMAIIPPNRNDLQYIDALAANYAGLVYAIRAGDILIYQATDLAPAGEIPGNFATTRYEMLDIDPTNSLYTTHKSGREVDLIKLNPDGSPAWRKANANDGLVKANQITQIDDLAVDGLGNIYLIDAAQAQVYRFDAQGNFVDRFGSKGEAPGQMESPRAVAVDGQGRIYVADYPGIHIFDHGGTYLKTLPGDLWKGVVFDIAFDLQDNLYVLTNQPQVYKYQVNWK
jgi:hypothetical protein